MQLKKMFTFRLKVNKSKRYMSWLKSQNTDKDFHHVVRKKTTDYLGILLTREEHQARHKNMDEYFEEDLVEAVNNLINYTRWLEARKAA